MYTVLCDVAPRSGIYQRLEELVAPKMGAACYFELGLIYAKLHGVTFLKTVMFIVIAVKPLNHAQTHKAHTFTIFFVCPRKKERVYSEGDANLASFVKLKISR
jgi:hypothetical protein